jgi:xanthine dehydrogenase small subunit
MTNFLLNGAPRTITPEPGRTVLDHLRLHERLTGTKEGCAEGDCGACTIAIGRVSGDTLKFSSANACIMLASELDGCAVVTAEGLAQNGALVPVQSALVEAHASQCGFCTPGFVMSLYAYAQNPIPESAPEKTAAIFDNLAGNLCRCTGYRPIIDAAATLHHHLDPRIESWRAQLNDLPADTGAPATLEELDAAFAAKPTAKLIAGTTDLGVAIAKHGTVPAAMISLRRIAELKTITETATSIIIGATATYSEILPYLKTHFPAFATLVRRIGAVQIRNLGTMGGNICTASPIGDSAPCLLALDATLHLRSSAGRRKIKIDDFFLAYRQTAMREAEYLTAIEIPFLKPAEKFFANKISKRFEEDISTVAAAFKVTITDNIITFIRTGFGGMAATPARAKHAEAALINQPLSPGTFAKAAEKIGDDFTPLSDFRATAGYRSQTAAGLIRRLGAQLMDPETQVEIFAL